MKPEKQLRYVIRNPHNITELTRKLKYCGIALVSGVTIGALIADGVAIAVGKPTIAQRIQTTRANPDYNSKLNDKMIKQKAEEIAELEGQEKKDALENYYAQAIWQNPGILIEDKPRLIVDFSYNVIQRYGEEFDAEAITRLIANASTVIYIEDANKLPPNNSGTFTPSQRLITVRDALDEKTNTHELMHGTGLGFRKGEYGRGLDEGAISFFSNDISYPELQRLTNIIGSIIGYDKLFDFYMTRGLDSIIKELETYTSKDKVNQLLVEMDQIYDLGTSIDYNDSALKQREMDDCVNSANDILKGIIEQQHNGKINLSKALIDYANVGNKVAELYGDMVYGLDELTIIFYHENETMQEIFKSGNTENLKKVMSRYLSPEDAEAFLNAMEQNFNVSYFYSLNNGITPNEFPKSPDQYDEVQYSENEKRYKRDLLCVCDNTGQFYLTKIFSQSMYHNPGSVYDIRVKNGNTTMILMDYYSRANNNNGLATKIDTEIGVPTNELKGMSTEEFRQTLSQKIASKTSITPDDIGEATDYIRTDEVRRVREELDRILDVDSKDKAVPNKEG